MKKTAFNLRLSQAWLPPKILLIMKLIIIIMTACLMQVSAAGFAQKITYSKKGATLEQIFSEIRKQTGYYVVYAENKVNKEAKLDVNFRNTELSKVLDVISNSQNLEYSLDDKNISLKPKEESVIDRIIARFQAIDVRGKVVDSLGNGLPGATVSIKNGKGSTSTAANGDFYLKNVEEGAVLVISYLGYITKEQPAIKEFNYVILKQSTSQLDEVLVQAYGTTTRRLSTGNIAMITSKEISQQNVNNPLLALQGRVAGVEVIPTNGLPGSPVNIRIRGLYSRNGEEANDPLIVIDGVPQANNIPGLGSIAGSSNGASAGTISALSFVNPSDIESISILKDADATSIYGSRGSKGVVLITTKRGQANGNNIDISVNVGQQDVTKKLDLLNTDQYLEMRKEGLQNDNLQFFLEDPESWAMLFPDMLAWDQKKYTDWQEVLLGNTAKYIDAQVVASGGAEYIQYRLGGGLHRETYVFPGESYDQKGNANLSISGLSANRKLKFRVSAGYMFNNNMTPPTDFTRDAMTLAPNAPDLYTENGEINWAPNPYSLGSFLFGENPAAILKRPFTQKLNSLVSSSDISYEILPRLVMKTALGYNRLQGTGLNILANLASTMPSWISSLQRSAYHYSNDLESWSLEPQITFNFEMGKGRVNALIGGSIQNQDVYAEQINAFGFNNDAVIESLSQAAGFRDIGNTWSEYKYNAIFGRLNYNLKDKYLVSLNARRDGSSRFGPARQFGNFWSIGTAWNFTEENFMHSLLPILNHGKVRFSYGTSGNDGIGDYRFFESYMPVNSIANYRGVKLLSSTGLSNPYYGWETVRKIEFGTDFGFFKDRLNVSAAYFRNRSSDLLGYLLLPSIAGPSSSLTVNQPALVQTSGWEFLLNSVNLSSADFRWSSSLNIGFNRNKLLVNNDGDRTKPGLGQPFYGFVNPAIIHGVDPGTGQYQFLGKDGQPTFNSSEALTSNVRTQPLFSGGLGNSFNYKRLSVDVHLYFAKQNGRNYIYQFDQTPGIYGNQPEVVMDRWKSIGDNALFQRFVVFSSENPVPDVTVSNAYLEVRNSSIAWVDASFIRLKTMSLSYDLSNIAKQKLRFKSVRLFAQGQNLLTWTKYEGTDPETQNPYVLPPLRTMTFGIQLIL